MNRGTVMPQSSRRRLGLGDTFRLSRTRLIPWLFLSIPLVVYLSMLGYPLICSFVLSLTKWSGMGKPPVFVGFTNYKYLLDHGQLALALKNNLLWMAMFVPIPAAAGFILALFLKNKSKLNVWLRSMFYLPMIISNTVLSIMWLAVYEPRHGMLTELLRFLHLPVPTQSYLTRPGTAIIAISIAGIWHWIGFPLVVYLAAVQDIPQELLEAAELDGASRLQKIWHIVIPLVAHATTIVVALGTILSMKVFDLIYLMTGGYYKNDVVGTLIWRYAYEEAKLGRASAVAVVEFLVIGALLVPYILYRRRKGELIEI